MLDSIIPPSIPRRPKKQSLVLIDLDSEGFDKSDMEFDSEQMVSLESLKSNDQKDKIPTIPKRPNRSKSSTRSRSIPVIPDRPQKAMMSSVETSGSSDLAKGENEPETDKSTDEDLSASNKDSEKLIEQSRSVKLDPELDNKLGLNDFDEDRTSDDSNIETNLKDLAGDDYSHRLEDNLEDTLRDENPIPNIGNNRTYNSIALYSSERYLNPKTSKVDIRDDEINETINKEESDSGEADSKEADSKEADSKEADSKEADNNEADSKEADKNISEKQNRQNDKFSSEVTHKKVFEKDIEFKSDDDNSKGIENNNPVSENIVPIEEKVADDKYTEKIPHIPRRPKKSGTSLTELYAKPISGGGIVPSNADNLELCGIEKKVTNDENTLETKKDMSQSRHEKTKLEKITAKPKAPPKPKKLSSKIAAFQQMFNHEQSPSKESPVIESTPKLDHDENINEDKQFPSRLSTDKMKFAHSLQGMMGKGIAMPGMINPNFQQKPRDVDVDEDEPPNNEVKLLNMKKGIAKGPRHKKLPRSLKNPVKVEDVPRFKTTVLRIWELDFQPRNKDIDKVKRNVPLPNTPEDLKLENNPEHAIGGASDQNFLSMNDSENDEALCKTDDHENIDMETRKSSVSETGLKDHEGSASIEDSESMDTSKISDVREDYSEDANSTDFEVDDNKISTFAEQPILKANDITYSEE